AVRQFGSLQLGGQVSSGGSSDIWGQLFGDSSSSGSSYGSSNGSSDIFFDIFGSLLSGQRVAPGKSINGLTADNSDWLDVDFIEDHADYILENSIDTTQLVWTNVKGQKLLILPEEQWDLVEDIELNLLYDDGFGYIDLGLDNLFTFDDEGNLIGDWDGTWIALNGQIAPYFMLSSESYDDGYVINGKIRALLNGEAVDILVTFTSENEDGVVLGARKCYDADTTLTVSKGLIPIEDGDEIQFICDYYNYNGTFEDGYRMDTTITVDGDLTISNVYLDDPENVVATYRISDIFNNHYWMPNLND
ncbi:MAG: peptidase C11, partial [Lachnospiraceae bacterium]|nr:peptidase C11 [Candidatus Equihabitans merdae]